MKQQELTRRHQNNGNPGRIHASPPAADHTGSGKGGRGEDPQYHRSIPEGCTGH